MTVDSSWLPAAHAVSTVVMVGIIWFVQVVHYPMFGFVGVREFPAWQQRNTRRTTLVVGPPMLVELMTAAGLLVVRGDRLAVAGAVLLVIIWASTALLQVPAHNRLEHGFDAAVHRRLVQSNWIRTVCWTARGVVALAIWLQAAGRA
jgi:hypothetical protein